MSRPDPYRDCEGPLAYLITFRCYGTWLHGDQRGSVDRTHNMPGAPVLEPDEAREKKEKAQLLHGPITLDPARRAVVDETIREVCRFRDWTVHALNVRTNHVHLVVSANLPPADVMNQLKAWSTRRMIEAGVIDKGTRTWSRHGGTRYLWTPEAVDAACRYVAEGCQGEDLPLQKPPDLKPGSRSR